MPRVWDEKHITEAIANAERDGRAVVTCDNPTDAHHFRLAIYNYRRRAQIGLDLQLSRSGSDVIITRAEPLRTPRVMAGD